LSIFSRIVIGYLVIFLLVVGINIYAFVQIGHFHKASQSALTTHNHVIDFIEKMKDAILAQVRCDRAFVATRDDTLYRQFLLFKLDFDEYLHQALSAANLPAMRDSLIRIRESHERYQSLVGQEVKYVKEGTRYSRGTYRQQKEKAVGETVEALEKLRYQSQKNTNSTIKRMGEAGAKTRRWTMGITAALLLLGVGMFLLINRSIIHPISIMKQKTREIARGIFRSDLQLSSPQELEELAGALNSMCKELRNLDEMKADFFSTISHELRTPLTSIKEGTNLLLDGAGGEVTDKQTRILRIIAEESNRLISLVNNSLDLSKMEAGMMEFHFDEADIVPLIKQAVREVEPLAMAKNVGLQIENSHDLPTIRMDQERILQVLRNLIGNAIKFTPHGGQVKIASRVVEGKVEVLTQDTGPGIPEEMLSTIFEKFHRAPSGDFSRHQGTGLGLAIVKEIIGAHGGKVWAESDLGRGSSLIFLLPASSPPSRT
jgi:two-component system, NtrC family, sensor histidine kinase GlrK